jgi:hypothetical protein
MCAVLWILSPQALFLNLSSIPLPLLLSLSSAGLCSWISFCHVIGNRWCRVGTVCDVILPSASSAQHTGFLRSYLRNRFVPALAGCLHHRGFGLGSRWGQFEFPSDRLTLVGILH